jgi:hypothetical protein
MMQWVTTDTRLSGSLFETKLIYDSVLATFWASICR